jgi:hypothetical protein
LLVVSDRESLVKGDFYDCNWKWLPLKRKCRPNKGDVLPRPKELDKVLDMARTLSKPFPHVRVDFYLENDRIMVGELTFFPGCGIEPFEPEKFDEIMGSYLNLPRSHNV